MSLATLATKVTNGIVVWTLATALLAVVVLVAPTAAAQNCARSGAPQPGDWIIDGGDPDPTQVCVNIIIVMDGDLIVRNGGSLIMQGGGLKFVQDTTNVYGISVITGGDLTFANSQVWTETSQINPYMKLTVSVSGVGSTLTLTDSTFAFPGTLDVSAGAVATFTRSTITGTTTNLGSVFGTPSERDDNDDAPGLTFTSSTVTFFGGRVEKLYEFGGLAVADPRQSIRLIGTATMTVVDTFLAIDVSNSTDLHNSLALADTSNAYLYGVSTDPEGNGGSQDLWTSPITAAGTARADIYRWANARVVDVNGVPVSGADIDAEFAGAQSGNATFRDNFGLLVPPASILSYLGKTAATWDDTGVDGLAHLPLLSDWIDATTMPNSRFVGTFNLHATAPTLQTGDAGLTFDAYPLMLAANAQKSATITISTLTLPLPDLVPLQPTFVPAYPLEGDTIDITAPIGNQGLGGAANVVVRIYDGVTLLSQQTIPFIGAGSQQSITATLVFVSPAGSHVILVRVDPDGSIIEGPGAGAEANNDGGFPLPVTGLGPDLTIQLTFNPDPGFLNNPVRLDGAVTNIGDGQALNVVIAFFMQAAEPDATSTPIGNATIPLVDVNGTATASLDWTPTSLGSFTFWAWADFEETIPEPLPYDNLVNNKDQNTLVVGAAPDLVVFAQDLTLTDPFPRVAAAGQIDAIVRNAGQAAAGPFRVDFFVDGVFRASSVSGGLAAGARVTLSTAGVSFIACGSHTIGVRVDAADQVSEGPLYELNNMLTQSVQVYPGDVVTWNSGTITADQAVSKSIEINGTVAITDARILVVQDQDPCGRYYMKVLAGGSLTLTNATLESNWPLMIFVAPGPPGPPGILTATDSTFNLDVQGNGALHSQGTLTVRSSTIMGNVVAKGNSADLRGDTFQGALLSVVTTGTSRLWDADLAGVSTIQLSSDAAGGALDFDIRNVTFNAAQTSQLVFSGDQWVQLTSVTLTKPGDWWTGMATQNARITRYWWLTVWTVDGTGTPIIHPTTIVSLERFNPTGPTPGWQAAPACALDECYFNTNNSWPVGIPQGRLLYRASAEDRYGNLPPEIRATYRASGSALVEFLLRFPDELVDGLVESDRTLVLVFSELTPDLSIDAVAFNGGNGNNIDFQPLNRVLTIAATVNNTGEIVTRNVFVLFYSTDVDSNLDGYMDNAHSEYVQSGAYIGSAGPFNVSALSTMVFTVTWTPVGTLEAARIVSAVVDPSTGPDPRAGGNLSELNEANNVMIRTMTAFIWADLHLDRNEQWALLPPVPIANNQIQISFNVINEGTAAATAVTFGVYDPNNNVTVGPSVVLDVGRGTVLRINVVWPTAGPGNQTIRIRAIASGTPGVDPALRRNFDYDYADVPSDNYVDNTFTVVTQPELSLTVPAPFPSPFRSQRFNLTVNVTNSGQTEAFGIDVQVTDVTNPLSPVILGGVTIDVAPGFSIRIVPNLQGFTTSGNRTLDVEVDPDNLVIEPNEGNNNVTIRVTVQAPSGEVRFTAPTDRQEFRPGAVIAVSGTVVGADGFSRIADVRVTARLIDPAGVEQANAVGVSASSDGNFLIPLVIPSPIPDATYTLLLDAEDASIADQQISVLIRLPLPWWQVPFLGLPVWIWLVVLIAAIAAIGGGTAYVKFVGLGKLVECGECGAFISEDSTTCPKCGVEFEKDMAKCSNCQAWIPVDVKQCPECGVEFATGEVQVADYEAKMRQQYEEVKRRFREQSSQELGRALTEREFEDWWRAQPTFVTFEDWLREEEEMRRMGSKPCPVCTTLNSVTATVCHKCGTLLKVPERTGGGPTPPPRPAAPRSQTPSTQAPEGGAEAGMPYDAVPKKVVKKPIGAPVVQKKVIKRPLEDKEDEGIDGEQEEI